MIKLLRILLPLFAMSASAQSASFTCSGALTNIETMVCRNQTLSALDEKMASEYLSLLKTPGNHSEVVSSQDQWRRRRNTCGTSLICLNGIYRERIEELNQYTGAPAAEARTSPAPSIAQGPTQPVTPNPSSTSHSSPPGPGAYSSSDDHTLRNSIVGGVIAVVLIVISTKYRLKRMLQERRRLALRVACEEIDRQARNLRIRRSQTIVTDIYGTVDTSKWEKEKSVFVERRIMPMLIANGVSSTLDDIFNEIWSAIENASLRPPDNRSEVAQYVSDPFVFDTRMNSLDYEKHCAISLTNGGWTTSLTAATGDQGADVLAEKDGIRMVVQCKLYSQPVGNKAIQEAYAASTFHGCDIAAVVSNAAYTPSARRIAATTGVFLLHHDELRDFDPLEPLNRRASTSIGHLE